MEPALSPPYSFDDIPLHNLSRPIVWQGDGSEYRLEKLTHPHHLLIEGRHMNHCIDKFEHNAFGSLRMIDGPDDAHRLRYWHLIEHAGDTIFSLVGNDGPLVTIHVGNQFGLRQFLNIKGRKNHRINGSEPYYPALLCALSHIEVLEGQLFRRPRGFGRARVIPVPLLRQWAAIEHDILHICMVIERSLDFKFELANYITEVIEAIEGAQLADVIINRRPPFDTMTLTSDHEARLVGLLLRLEIVIRSQAPPTPADFQVIEKLPPVPPSRRQTGGRPYPSVK